MAGAGGNHSAEAAEPSLPALPLAACSSATPLFVKLFAIWNSTHRRLRSCTRKSGGRAPVDTGLGTLGGSAAASGRLSGPGAVIVMSCTLRAGLARSEEHTSELQSLMRISYAVFCLKTKNRSTRIHNIAFDPPYYTR